LLGEPFSFPADTLLERLNDDQPGIPVLGGMASAAHAPGQNCLWLNDQVHSQGAVAVLLHGNISIQSVVSQGCRPIGQTFVVTKAERNLIYELGGVPAMQRLQEVAESLAPEELQLINRGLHVGRVTSEYQENFARGDFLIRNVVGHDRENGALAVGDYIRVGQTVQFHVRDADTADEDLRALLAAAPASDAAHSTGALLFTCNGRGTRLFDQPHHDASVVAELLNAPPVAGFFAQGEIGPISGKNFLHGFTASLAVFSPLKSAT
jgi:small ligand-binding sensory domain FIST